MKKLAIIALAAAMLSAPAFAQTATTLSPGSNPTSLPTDTDNDFGKFMESFTAADFNSAYDDLDSAQSVSVIKLSGMANANAKSFQDGYAAKESDVATLRGRLSNNVAAKAALESAGFTIDQVVAIDAEGQGSVTLYVNDMVN